MAFGSEWLRLGGYPGGKTEGLLQLDALKLQGLAVLRGASIGASYFIEFNAPYDLCRRLPFDAKITASLHEVNRKIVNLTEPQTWLAIRSSATDEDGASGIYDSRFYLTRGDGNDVDYLEGWEEVVYRSYLTEDAKKYQRVREIMGMGLLIQPIAGSWYGKDFAPAISGVCTVKNGQPLTKAVIGLGTKAVGLDEGLIFYEPDIDLSSIRLGLKRLQYADVLDSICLGVNVNFPIVDKLRNAAIKEAPKLFHIYSLHQKLFQEGKPFYWEFAIDPRYKLPLIVQSSSEVIQTDVEPEYGEPEGRVIIEGQDVVNVGVKEGTGLFYLADCYDLDALAKWDKMHSGYVLVLNDADLSKGYRQISFRHFSNAAAVVELQSSGVHPKRGGSHFLEICKRLDILFLGGYFDYDQFFEDMLMKQPTIIEPSYSCWNLRFRVTNTKDKGRFEVFES